MINKISIVLIALVLVACNGNAQQRKDKKSTNKNEKTMKYPVQKTEEEWQKILSPQEYQINRLKGTEYPSTGKYNMHFEKGEYHCKGCGAKLFESDSKFKTHCGWPGFDRAIPGSIVYVQDNSHGMQRTEILCAKCGGHLGHVFDDGPTETGKRYCVNSASIDFEKDK